MSNYEVWTLISQLLSYGGNKTVFIIRQLTDNIKEFRSFVNMWRVLLWSPHELLFILLNMYLYVLNHHLVLLDSVHTVFRVVVSIV